MRFSGFGLRGEVAGVRRSTKVHVHHGPDTRYRYKVCKDNRAWTDGSPRSCRRRRQGSVHSPTQTCRARRRSHARRAETSVNRQPVNHAAQSRQTRLSSASAQRTRRKEGKGHARFAPVCVFTWIARLLGRLKRLLQCGQQCRRSLSSPPGVPADADVDADAAGPPPFTCTPNPAMVLLLTLGPPRGASARGIETETGPSSGVCGGCAWGPSTYRAFPRLAEEEEEEDREDDDAEAGERCACPCPCPWYPAGPGYGPWRCGCGCGCECGCGGRDAGCAGEA